MEGIDSILSRTNEIKKDETIRAETSVFVEQPRNLTMERDVRRALKMMRKSNTKKSKIESQL
jgi:hypothetical protein